MTSRPSMRGAPPVGRAAVSHPEKQQDQGREGDIEQTAAPGLRCGMSRSISAASYYEGDYMNCLAPRLARASHLGIGKVQAQLLVGIDVDRLTRLYDLEGQRRVGQAKDGTVRSVTAFEGLDERQSDNVAIEADRLLEPMVPARETDGSDARKALRPDSLLPVESWRETQPHNA